MAKDSRAAVALGHDPASWDWAREALSTMEAVARAIDPTLTSQDGLAVLVSTVERLPGGHQQTRKRMAEWRSCERFLCEEIETAATARALIAEAAVPDEGSLARERESVLARFDDSRDVVRATSEVKVAATSWLEKYRKHYLAWHARVHAGARFEKLIHLRQSTAMEAMRRLARVGLCAEKSAKIEA
ncbi:MAG: hypothetical protein JXA57_20620, partial [Armatimonadetes bacterium]|nr:hypothetical protein [Armatimonadota bacterium]